MKRLALLRHAKAELARADLPDADRNLSARGRIEAREAAQCLAKSGLPIDALLVSPAVRTRETAHIVITELDLNPQPQFEPALYLASPEVLWHALRRCPQSLETVLMIGHNPGLSEFARQFAPGHAHVELHTAGLCSVEFGLEAQWSTLRPEFVTAFRILR
jgi:phosphohistidine phosphatase